MQTSFEYQNEEYYIKLLCLFLKTYSKYDVTACCHKNFYFALTPSCTNIDSSVDLEAVPSQLGKQREAYCTSRLLFVSL